MTQWVSLGQRGKMYSLLSLPKQQLIMLCGLTAELHPQEMLTEIKQQPAGTASMRCTW